MKQKILVIIASVRPKRVGGKVGRWVMDQLSERSSTFDYSLLDLREVNLPFFDEPVSPRAAEHYEHQHTRDWSDMIAPASGFIIVTPEYNHGYPPSLKNAVDFLYREWKGKPAGFVGYGGSGARDSIRQMREVLARFRMKVAENQLGISQVWDAFDGENRLNEDLLSGDFNAFIDELEKLVTENITPAGSEG